MKLSYDDLKMLNPNTTMSDIHIICEESIVYENGAFVATSFVTSFGEWFIDSAPTLAEAIKAENKKNKEKKKVTSPKYEYPNEVLTATMVGGDGKKRDRL